MPIPAGCHGVGFRKGFFADVLFPCLFRLLFSVSTWLLTILHLPHSALGGNKWLVMRTSFLTGLEECSLSVPLNLRGFRKRDASGEGCTSFFCRVPLVCLVFLGARKQSFFDGNVYPFCQVGFSEKTWSLPCPWSVLCRPCGSKREGPGSDPWLQTCPVCVLVFLFSFCYFLLMLNFVSPAN